MKQKHTAYRLVQALLLVSVLMLLSVSVLAQDTTLKTIVPSTHTLHIELTGNGTVIVDGISYTKSAEVQIARHSKPSITLQAANGSATRSVLWGSENVTAAVRNGTWLAPEVTEDTVLSVTFDKNQFPATGDSAARDLLCFGALLLLSLTGIILCAAWKKKEHTA